MKSTGVVRKIDNLGRLVLPKETRTVMNLPEGTPMEMFTDGETIVLKKYQPGCVFCGSMDELTDYRNKHICLECKSNL